MEIMDSSYDLIVVGAGVAGYTASIRGAEAGLRVALIEKREIGGTCVNMGCIPTKCLIDFSKRFLEVYKYAELSVLRDKIISHIRRVTESLKKGMIENIYDKKIEFISADILDGNMEFIVVDELGKSRRLNYKNLLIATGAKPIVPNNISLTDNIITTDKFFDNDNILPKSIIILGGGVIGCELASCLTDFGVDVTIVEANKRILWSFSKSISYAVSTHLKKKGVKIYCECEIQEVKEEDSEVYVTVRMADNNVRGILSNKLLIAVGRIPSIDYELFRKLGINEDEGKIITDNAYRTSNPNVYAIGDVCTEYMLAYIAERQAELVIKEIVGGYKSPVECVPLCVYMDMEILQIGVSSDVTEHNDNFSLCRISMKSNCMANICSKVSGFCTIIVNEDDESLAGVELFCQNAIELSGECRRLLLQHIKISEIAESIYPHPSYVEILKHIAIKYLTEKKRINEVYR